MEGEIQHEDERDVESTKNWKNSGVLRREVRKRTLSTSLNILKGTLILILGE